MPKRPSRESSQRKKSPSPTQTDAKAKKSARTKQPKPTAEKSAAPLLAAIKPVADLRRIFDDMAKVGRLAEFRVSCVRPDDLLVCDFIFENFNLQTNGEGAPKLLRKPGRTGILTVEFPPQSFGEEALLDETGAEVPANEVFPESCDKDQLEPPNNPSPNPPPGLLRRKNKSIPTPGETFKGLAQIRIRMGGPSRIAFDMPDAESELAFTVEAILDACRRWPMRLDVNAVPDPPRFRFRRDLLGFRDLWLGSVVSSNAWKETTKTLVDTLGGAHEKRLAAAARRISDVAVEAIRSGSTEVEAMLHGAIDEELDVIGQKFASLHDENQRQVAAAALSFMTTEALSKRRVGVSVLDLLAAFPFFRVIFPPHEPAYNVTALELPYRLIISPISESRWHHSPKAVTRNGRTELWHSRLTSSKKDVGPDQPTNVRALWSPDYHLPDINDKVNNVRPYRMSLDPLDREMLVKLMAGFDEDDAHGHRYHPLSAHSRRLALSSLGALLDVEGNWDPPAPAGVGLEQWRHLATLGRDHYVRVVYRGFLCHPRHAATLVKVTERKFEPKGQTQNRVAVLRQKFFIVVRERLKHYDGSGHEFGGRNFPFTDVEILTRVTPTLLAPDQTQSRLSDPGNVIYNPGTTPGPNPKPLGVPHRACFWPMLNTTTNFMFRLAGTDLSGKRVTFSMPLLFVGIEANEHWDENIMKTIIKQYDAETANPRRIGRPGGASICYAQLAPGAKGDPRFPTSSMIFRAARVDPKIVSTDEAQFYPEVETASVDVPAIQRLLQKPDASIDVKYPDVYKGSGFGAGNDGELFLTVVDPFDLGFGNTVKSDNIGSLATPSMQILGLSRLMGPVAGQKPTGTQTPESNLADIIGNNFTPASFFSDAKILGGVKLVEILGKVFDLTNDAVPKLLSRETEDSIEASFDWKTSKIQGDPAGLFIPNADGAKTQLEMHGVVSARRNADAPTFSATATLDHFKVNLFGFVTIWFDLLRFSSKTGSKPDVAVELHPGEHAIEFGGPLEFVNELRNIIPSNGFSDPPGLSVTPSGISASYSINIPSLAVGIFALEHLSLGAGFLLPFDARPAEVRFNFCERQRPFSLTVSLLGGGGFFAICVGTEGVREIEAAIEFGAALSIDLGVASGSVEVKAGVYFHWKTNSVELAGYVRLHGELSVLGLISASLTFNLQLAYLKENGHSVVWGEATLEVEIEVLFLSFSVSVSCRREFGGSSGDPKFIELIPDQTTWDEYCGAFAKEAA